MGHGAWAYLTLLFLGFAVLGIAYWKIKSFRIFIFYFTVSGVTLLFDYIIYVWGKAYRYKPGILEGIYDTHIGALANGHVLPSFAVLFIVCKWKWYWSIPLALFFTWIELIFRDLGIFEGYWWSPWYTWIGLSIYFPIARLWWKYLQKKWIYFGTMFFSYYSIFIPLNILLYAVLKTRSYHIEWIEELHRHSSSFNTVTATIFGLIIAFVSHIGKLRAWFPVIALGFIAYDLLLKYMGVVTSEHIVLDSILSFFSFFLGYLFVQYADSHIKDLVKDI